MNYLTVCKLHDRFWYDTLSRNKHWNIQRICAWPLLQRIQMKQFGHLIRSHQLFILLWEVETLGFSSQRDPGTPSILMSKSNAMQKMGWITAEWKQKLGVVKYPKCSRTGMNHHAESKSNCYKSHKNTKCGNITYWAHFHQVQTDADQCLCCRKVKQPDWSCERKTPCGDIVWVAGRTGKLPQIITSEINLMWGIQSVVIGTAAALEWSSKCYLLIHGMRTDTQSRRIDCAISSLCAVLTQWKREMRFNVVMRGSL